MLESDVARGVYEVERQAAAEKAAKRSSVRVLKRQSTTMKKVKLDFANEEHARTLIAEQKRILEDEWQLLSLERRAAFVKSGRQQRPLEGDVLLSVNGIDVRRLEALLHVPLRLYEAELDELIAEFHRSPEETVLPIGTTGVAYRGPERRATMSKAEDQQWTTELERFVWTHLLFVFPKYRRVTADLLTIEMLTDPPWHVWRDAAERTKVAAAEKLTYSRIAKLEGRICELRSVGHTMIERCHGRCDGHALTRDRPLSGRARKP